MELLNFKSYESLCNYTLDIFKFYHKRCNCSLHNFYDHNGIYYGSLFYNKINKYAICVIRTPEYVSIGFQVWEINNFDIDKLIGLNFNYDFVFKNYNLLCSYSGYDLGVSAMFIDFDLNYCDKLIGFKPNKGYKQLSLFDL